MNESFQTLISTSTILLAEDCDDDAFLMRRAFSKAHLLNPLTRVKDGEEAIAYLRGDGEYADRERYPIPFLLLLDLKMPRTSGFEVLSWVRDQPELKRMLIVILTSSTHAQDIETAYELGANSYLNKPANFAELMELLARLQGYWLMTNVPPDLRPTNEVEMAH